MAQFVVMPALGNTVESCLISSWQVSVGDAVDANTTLCEIETDKSTMDVPAGISGTVLALLAEEGDDVPVKTPIAVVGEAGENVEELLASAGVAPNTTGEAGEVDESAEDALTPPAAPATAEPPTASPAAGATPSATPATAEPLRAADSSAPAVSPDAAPAVAAPQAATAAAPSGVSPRARARAAAEGLALDALSAGTGPHGRVIERDVETTLAAGPRPTRGAFGQDVSATHGTGLGGRVTSDDLTREAIPAPAPGQPTPTQPAAAPAATAPDFPGAFSDTPLKGIRKLIAERMLNALAVSAQLTYTSTADAAGMLALRKRFKASDPELGYSGITLGDLVCFATVQVLKRHANLNAHLTDGALRAFESVHLGLAVDTPRGLLVPTIRNADRLTVRQLSNTTKQLAGQAREGKIDPQLLAGATFTVSNLGAFGIESFTPIINVPQTGILGVNTISPRAYAQPDGSVGVQQRIGFSLTADHQVVDGADAGRFLADLVKAIEAIDLTVMG